MENIQNEVSHPEMVRKLKKNSIRILDELYARPDLMDALHMAVGVSGEAGELLDAVKKLAIYNKPMDDAIRANIIEELGDLEFYMEGLRQTFSIDRRDTLNANKAKLAIRYQKLEYSNEAAELRADKA